MKREGESEPHRFSCNRTISVNAWFRHDSTRSVTTIAPLFTLVDPGKRSFISFANWISLLLGSLEVVTIICTSSSVRSCSLRTPNGFPETYVGSKVSGTLPGNCVSHVHNFLKGHAEQAGKCNNERERAGPLKQGTCTMEQATTTMQSLLLRGNETNHLFYTRHVHHTLKESRPCRAYRK